MSRNRVWRLFLFSASFLLVAPGSGRAQPNQAVCTTAGEQNFPQTTSDGAGGAIITWEDPDASAGIHAHHVLPSGVVDPAWPANGTALCAAPDHQGLPAIVSDGAGGAIVAWHDFRDGVQFDIYAQHVLSTGAVDPAWPLDGRALCTAVGDQGYVTIASDGGGGAIVAWDDYRSGSEFHVYAQHVSSSGTVDPAWPLDGRAVSTVAYSTYPQAVSDGAGGAIVVWENYQGGDSDIYAQRVLATGAVDPTWPNHGRALCNQANDQTGVAVVSDNAGGAIVAWEDYRSGIDYDVYAQRVLVTGGLDPLWPSTGRALCAEPGDQFHTVIVSDGSGGAIVGWQDFRTGARYEIYAQHVSSAGAVDAAWPSNGRDLSSASNDQWRPTIASDGAGGAIVAWENLLDADDADIYAQHVLHTGTVDATWPSDGRVVSSAADDQSLPSIVSDNTGGAIIGWRDRRDAVNYHIYAQRILSSGTLVAVSPAGGPDRFMLGPAYPNPVRGDQTTIPFVLPSAQSAFFEVFDVTGQRVRTLDSVFSPGLHPISWDGRNDAGVTLPGGVYFLRARWGASSETQRIVLLR